MFVLWNEKYVNVWWVDVQDEPESQQLVSYRQLSAVRQSDQLQESPYPPLGGRHGKEPWSALRFTVHLDVGQTYSITALEFEI